jgi:DMSO/TMAO reductase YedYZ molybdopterin-dependent catalytic subunit
MVRHRFTGFVVSCCLAFAAHGAEPAVPASGAPTIRVLMQGKPALTIDPAMLSTMPHVTTRAAAHDEKPSEWRGVALRDILLRAGVSIDQPLRGKALATFVRVTATDHYQVIFGLADLDPTLGNTPVMLADERDGKSLSTDGPFRLVVSSDKRPARWVRNVATIEVVDGSTAGQP